MPQKVLILIVIRGVFIIFLYWGNEKVVLAGVAQHDSLVGFLFIG